ncbi:uncharacterized protein LOC135482649 [Lineus longissimus]|uniref:uncharacterized protein LOC135482649 n=1 Tax=Lineus longissimus TaxID=88925 RepID=UPI00315D011D
MNLSRALKAPAHETIKAPLKVTIVALSTKKTIKATNNTTITFWTAAIADENTVTKINLYDEHLVAKCNPNKTVIMTSTKSRADHLTTNPETRIYSTKFMHVPEQLINEGKLLINPPDAHIVTLKNAATSPLKTRLSVQGTVTQVEEKKTVIAKGKPVQIQTVTLKDKTALVKCTLWREAADTNLMTPGNHVKITNAYTHYSTFHKAQQLNTSDDSSITLVEEPPRFAQQQLIAIDISEIPDELTVLAEEDDNYQEFSTTKQVVLQAFEVESLDDIQDILPATATVTIRNKCITAIALA